ncbi:hypothetical protein Mapa_002691 [Marchantia paleacea]|nr:hypothetical protein Mapa_002691 [Marchantia paleacea]
MFSKYFGCLSFKAGGGDTEVGEHEFRGRSLASTDWNVEVEVQSPGSLRAQSRRRKVLAPLHWHPVTMKDHEERSWAALNGEVLVEIFDLLSFEERVTILPLVCKDWREASLYPASWRNVDMIPWITWKANSVCIGAGEVNMDRLVRFVVDRSCGKLRKLRTRFCTNETVDYLAEKCPQLTVLSIRDSIMINDESAVRLAERCTRIEELDLSDCYNMSAKSIEVFGKKCPQLIGFARNMINMNLYEDSPPRGDEEASAIAMYMVNLKHLELKRMSTLTGVGLMHIASSCKHLENLNISCCSDLSPAILDKLPALCPKLKDYVRPIIRQQPDRRPIPAD